ncbi:acyl-CoA dehydrogenase family protein, partial [Rhodococcus rhodnii]
MSSSVADPSPPTTDTDAIPRPDSREFEALIDEIAWDARRRRDDGGSEGPFAAIDSVRRARLGAARVPASLGGGGWTVTELLDAVVSLAEADPDVPHILRVHFAFVEELLRLPVDDPARVRWLPEIVAGAVFGGAASELSRHDVGGLRYDTTAADTEDGVVVDGRKFYSTGSLYSDYIRVTARADDGEPLSVVVPAHAPGVEHVDDWDGIGQRHTGSGTTIFTGVEVGRDAVLPRRSDDPASRPRHSLLQLHLHAIAAGILRSVVTDAAALLRSRKRTFTYATSSVPVEDPQLLAVVGELT